ncbi:DNA damage-binding protein 1 [Capsicum annuum]|nr:DNA damage-binding protein 1 [Capsicum annuum]
MIRVLLGYLKHSENLRDFVYCRRIKIEEVKCAVSWMSRGRTTGSNEILMEFWRSSDKASMEWLTELFNNVFKTTKIPEGWRCMEAGDVLVAYIRVIKDIYDGATTWVRTVGVDSKRLPVEMRLHQGSILSPFLFALDELPWCMLFADDIVLIDETQDGVNARFEEGDLGKGGNSLRGGGQDEESETEMISVCEEEVRRRPSEGVREAGYRGYAPMLDVPIYGRIATLELFRPHGETQDLLFIATERYKFCVLQWDAEASEVITRAMGDVSDRIGRPTDNGQIGIIDPDCRLIGLHLYDGLFKVIPFDNKGQLKEAFNIRLEELQVLDIKFLYGCPKPTIVVLYQDNKDARHVKTYEVSLKDKDFIEGPWAQNNLDNGASLLIPVPPPLCGVLIIGEETIVYCSASAFKAIPIRPSITRAYGRVDADGSRYLLGDHNGLLHLLVITHEKEKVTGLKIELLGETSIASTISYLDNAFVFIGSSYGDSQLVKLNLQPDAKGSYVEVLERYVNLGPIVDFCVVDLERQGQGQVVTCSGAYKDGSLRIVRNGIGINEQASVELQGIKGMWSLRSATDDPYDTFLVVSFISETRVLAMNLEDELEETEIEGFNSQVQTLFCHDAVYNQLVQVTSNSVRLVSSSSRELKNEWFAPAGYSVNVATANATQVLLATGGGHLVYLEIGDGVLNEVKYAKLDYDISCLDINPIGESPNYSNIAAVGMWTDISVRIYSLPDLNLITKEQLGGEIIPRSVLMCSFEGVCTLYLYSVLVSVPQLCVFVWGMTSRGITFHIYDCPVQKPGKQWAEGGGGL